MNLERAVGRSPLVLLVDPDLTSRHRMWRTLSGPFGVLEARGVRHAADWIARRPDIQAVVVRDVLPDGSGLELLGDLCLQRPALARRTLVLSSRGSVTGGAYPEAILVEASDLDAIARRLTGWFLPGQRLARA